MGCRSRMMCAVGLLFVATGCCGKGGKEMVKAQEGFADKVCACTDVECVKKVQKEQEEWVTAHGGAAVGNESDGEKIAAANKRLTDCAMKVMKEGATKGPAAADSKGPAAPADTAKAAPAAGGDLFSGPALVDVAGKFKEKVGGPLKVLEMTIHPNQSKIQAQDPKKPDNVDQYEYRNGKIEGPVPVKITKIGGGTIESNLFPLDEVNLAGISDLITKAVAAAKVEDGKATHIVIKRGLPQTKDVRIRIFIKGPRKDGWADADTKGTIVKTST